MLATLFLAALVASADPDPPPGQTPSTEVKPATTVEWATTCVALAGAAAIDRWVRPATCRWCDRNASGDDTLNGFDASMRSALRWSDPHLHSADVLSYVTEYAPMSLLFIHPDRQTPTRALVTIEALAATQLTVGGLKAAFARERPNVHFAADTGIEPSEHDVNKSFPSGHASGAWAIAMAMASQCRLEQCSYERSIWMIGMPLAATTMWLRIASDQHYMTDVLVGAGIGGAIGWWLPQLRQRTDMIQPSIGQQGWSFDMNVRW